MQTGKFIVFEGIDGCGKTTQLQKLAAYLTAHGRRVFVTAEPTHGVWGRQLRQALSGELSCTPAEMAALFVLDRLAHNREIDGALAAGQDVLCDRYYYSSLAYQGSLCDYEWVRRMNCECPAIRHPDLCVFLDIMPAAALARIGKRGTAREIYENEETLSLFRDTFLRVLGTLGDPVATVDAAGTPDEVAARVAEQMKTLIKC